MRQSSLGRADLDRLAETVARFSVLAHQLGDALAELDVNPLLATADGAIALDSLIIPAGRSASDSRAARPRVSRVA